MNCPIGFYRKPSALLCLLFLHMQELRSRSQSSITILKERRRITLLDLIVKDSLLHLRLTYDALVQSAADETTPTYG